MTLSKILIYKYNHKIHQLKRSSNHKNQIVSGGGILHFDCETRCYSTQDQVVLWK
jgi:hypothetical protein